MQEILYYLAALIAEIAGTIAGFGSSTIFLPLSLFFMPFQSALIMVAIFHVFGNIGRISFFRKGVEWKLILRFGIPALILTVIGALLASYASTLWLLLGLGAFLLVFSILSLTLKEFRLKPNNATLTIGGILSGLFAGLLGTGGAPRAASLSAYNLEKEKYIATNAMIALGVDITRIIVYLNAGFLTQEYYNAIIPLFIVAIIGAYIGKRIVDHIPQSAFRTIVLTALLLIGIKFIVDSLGMILG
ncbi:MAG: sulfite exporter TauE/SafE family protein [Candidatus Woesearchaeota archaeon]